MDYSTLSALKPKGTNTTATDALASLLPQNSNNGSLLKPASNALGSVGNYASILQSIGDVTSNLMQVGNNEEGMSESQIDSRNKQIAGSTTASVIALVCSILTFCAAAA